MSITPVTPVNSSSGHHLPPITVHGGTIVRSDDQLSVLTPAEAWSYAASFPVQAPDRPFVAELTIRVKAGSVGVSYVDRTGQSLRHEVIVAPTLTPCLIQQVLDPGELGLVMIRTGAVGASALVDIDDFAVRPLTKEEVAAAETPSVLEPVDGWSAFYGNHARSIAEQVRSLQFHRLEAGTRHKWIEGLSVIVAPGEQISRALYVSGLYEPATALVLKSWLGPGATFLDIGANIGLFTLLGSRWVGASGRVIAAEPSPRERARLAAHLELNALENVDVVAAAVADHEGAGELVIASDEHSGLNTLAGRFPYAGVQAAGKITVPLVTIDSLVERAALARVDVIKLDIEGGEYGALVGAANALRRFRPRLIVEMVAEALSACGASAEALQELLDRAGYEVFAIDERAALQQVAPGQPLADGNVAAIPRERSDEVGAATAPR